MLYAVSKEGFVPLEGGARELGTLLFALQLVSHGKAPYFRGRCGGPAPQPRGPFLPWGCPGVVPLPQLVLKSKIRPPALSELLQMTVALPAGSPCRQQNGTWL